MLPQTNSSFLNAIAPPAGASSHVCFKEIPSRTMAGSGLGDVFGRSLVRGLSLRFVQNIQGGLSLGARHPRWQQTRGKANKRNHDYHCDERPWISGRYTPNLAGEESRQGSGAT